MPGSNPSAKLRWTPAVSPGHVGTPLPRTRGSIFACRWCATILSFPGAGSGLGIVSWRIMEELAHPSQATQRICHSASNKIAWSASAPLHYSSHLERGPSLPPVGQWVSQAWELLRAGISPSTAAETMGDSKTSYSQVWMSASLQQVLALGLFWPWNILHWKHTVTRLETVLTTLERAPFRRDNVNFPGRSFQSQTGKCFRSEDVTQVCWYRLKSGDWQLPLFHCRSTVVFSGS